VARARRVLPLFFTAMVVVGALPAAAQQPPPSAVPLVLPAPSAAAPDWAAAGAPPILDPDASARLGREPLVDCGRDLPCRVRLRGVLGKNGAVAVEGTAFTW
jgi:hypothetical protein